MILRPLFYFGLLFISGLIGPLVSSAQNLPVGPLIIISPAKNEVQLEPGGRLIRNIYITNRLGHDARFHLTVEDVAGSKNPAEAVTLYGGDPGPYSLKDNLIIDGSDIFIKSGERQAVPVLIALPPQSSPGGQYAGIFVSEIKDRSAASGPQVTTRVGALFFVRVNGPIIERGTVKTFNIPGNRQLVFTSAPLTLQTVFENTGNVYLNPYGRIDIKNGRGKLLSQFTLEPWYVFPDAVRARQTIWTNPPLFGHFIATLTLNSGYSVPEVHTQSYSFWIVSGWWLFGLIAGLITLIILVRLVIKLR